MIKNEAAMVWGPRNNYFPSPIKSGNFWWGAQISTCTQYWIFADGNPTGGVCPISGDPLNPAPYGKTLVARSMRIQGLANGLVSLNQWKFGIPLGVPRLKLNVKAGNDYDLWFGPKGVVIGDMPFISTNRTQTIELYYDII